MRVSHSVHIRRDPADVWAFVSDYRNDPTFIDAVESSAFVGDPVVEVGARLRRTMRLPVVKKTSRVDIEVVRHEPPTLVAFYAKEGPLSFVETRTVEPADGGTRVTFVLEGDPSGVLRLGERFMEGQAKKAMTKDLDNLKRRLESTSRA